MRILILFLALAIAVPAWAQFPYSASASTRLYFGHFADGGPPAQHWTTTLIVNNPGTEASATVRIAFYNDEGQPLPIDFGQGPSAIVNLTIPPGGMRTLTSLGASTTTAGGWGVGEADRPVTGLVLYRATSQTGGVLDVASPGSGSTYFFNSYANGALGLALANPSSTTVAHLQITARNENGVASGPWSVEVPRMGHRAFNLTSSPIGLPPTFTGSIAISSTDATPSPFVVVALNYRDPVLSPLPPGETLSPGPPDRRPQDAAVRVRQAEASLVKDVVPYLLGENPTEIINYITNTGFAIDADNTVRARYTAADGKVHISTATIELLGTSDAALAFIFGHMIVHGIFTHTGVPPTGPFANDAEGAADTGATAALMKAGFDPMGGAEFLGRLQFAYAAGLSIDPALRSEFDLPNGIPARLQKLYNLVASGCEVTTGMGQVCQASVKYWYPRTLLVMRP